MSIIAQTPRLTIREYKPEEEQLFVDLHKDPQVLKFIPNRTDDENRALFRDSFVAYADGSGLSRWGMFDRQTGEFIGACLLRPFRGDATKSEIGYSIQVKHWGKGYATEMAEAIVDYGFNKLNRPVICAITTLDNTASQKVLLNAGLLRQPDLEFNGMMVAFFEGEKEPKA
jgi:ribosomal-protein-alanine N-acetyltransferase